MERLSLLELFRDIRKQLGACDQNKRILVLTLTHDGKFYDKCQRRAIDAG